MCIRDSAPGEKEQVKIWIPWRELAVYDEERAAWVIESGDYLLKMGKSSRDTFTVGMVCLRDTVLTEQCANRLTISGCNRGKLSDVYKRQEQERPLKNKKQILLRSRQS